MKIKKIIAALLAVTLIFSAVGCSSKNSEVNSSTGESQSADASDTGGNGNGGGNNSGNADEDKSNIEVFSFSPDGVTVTDTCFIDDHCSVKISAPEGSTVYYSTDGSDPDSNSEVYSEPIPLELSIGDFPACTVIRAKAVYSDGSQSETVTHSFFSSLDIRTRYSNVVFSITGDPDDLFNKPDGLFYGNNYEKRGKESEIPAHIEAITSKGETIFDQDAGLRIYGAASRGASIKSFKLFARKSYDPDHGKFKTDIFGTVGADGEVINKYDKLVLRNAGNDFQFAFIRDELNQRLAQQAGYTDYEAVVPAVVYLNGEYYGLLWLHETYCDDLLKDKYGDGEGHFEIIEGGESYKKTDDDDAENAKAAQEFSDTYNKLAYSDLTDDKKFEELNDFIDVENYLQNYAFNIYVNNWDWPQNNYKCYRYYASEGESYADSGELDGRWRFIFHDTDYCMGLYGQDLTLANYNNIKQIMREKSDRYSPLFTALMQRDDCREYFLQEVKRLMDDVLSKDNISQTLDSMNAERYGEMKIYYKHLEEMKSYDDSIWSWYDEFLSRTENIRIFASQRADYMKKYLKTQFDLSDDYFD